MLKVSKVKRKYRKPRQQKKYALRNILNEKYKIILLLVSIFSILIGSLLYNNFNELFLNDILKNTIGLFSTQNTGKIFAFLLKTEILFLCFTMLIGTSFVGTPLTFLPISLRCIITGYFGGFMYNEYELKGVLFCLLFIFPYTAIACTSLLFAANESIYMSNVSYKTITNKNTADDISVRLYLLRYLVLLIINGICALFNSFVITLFINKINL